jgi:formate C-acetyltransferase
MTDFYLNAYYENINELPILREARALYAFWANAPLKITAEQRIVGLFNADESAGFHYGVGTWVRGDARGEVADAVRARVYKYYNPEVLDERELLSIEAHASTTTWFAGHGVLDFERLLEIGLMGYRRELTLHGFDAARPDFYRACDTVLEGIRVFIRRLADTANDETATVLAHIADKPPETFQQALQLVWVLHYLDNSDSFGRFDYYLRRFFENEMDEKNAKALLTDFWRRIEDVNEIQNMTLGGEYNELTRLCLEVTAELRFKGPNMCLRVTPDMPDTVWATAMNCLAAGTGQPALYHDEMYTAALLRSGVPKDIARNYCFGGCSQIMLPGRCNFANDIGMLNVGKIFELTLYGGFDPRINKQVGPKTPTDFSRYDDFYQAFIVQLEYGCVLQTTIHNKDLPERGRVDGFALRSVFTRGCAERGLGFYEGGAEYNHVQLEIIGLTNAADALYAMKTVVFDEGKLTFAALVEMLRADWDGAEAMQRYFIGLPKFGNDHAEVDAIRAELAKYLYGWFNTAPGPFGGIYVPGEVIFTAHEHCGAVVGATPDGRHAGTVLADSAGAAAGASREGPTALMNSMLTQPSADYLLTSVVLNLRFLPETMQNPRTQKGVKALLRGFLLQGGMQVQINVCDTALLIAAQKNPELYPDLIVRVGGYSDYFTRLSKGLQDEIITRTEYVL